MAEIQEKNKNASDSYNWAKIRSEYVTKNITYSALCDEHGCSMSTLTKRASKERWLEAKKKHRKKVERKIEEKAAARKAEKAVKEKTELKGIKSIVKTDDLKKLSATLKDIRDVLQSDDENKDSTLTVILEGALKDYGK